ncbi:MAG TPA: ABC transporter permease [Terracidiphilus sp.]|jgi:predicted permease|nr:ABC transporter permease [Terracidiphilus sp.]
MLSDLSHRLRALFRGNAVDAEMDEELADHLDREAEKYRSRGFSSDEAMRRARMSLRGVEQARQQCRESRGTVALEILGQDVRYGLRMLRKTPGVTFLILLSLAIGIGANTAIFSVTNTLLLKPLPYPDPDRLALLWLRSPGIGIPQDWPSPGQYYDIRTKNHVFDQTAILIDDSYALGGMSKAMKVDAVKASSGFLPMLGAKPLLGRIFLPAEDRHGNGDNVVLTYGFWKEMFGGDPGILGRSLQLNAKAYTIVGVLSQDFRLNREAIPTIGGIESPQVFLSLPMDSTEETNYGPEDFNILARLKPGVTPQEAQADTDRIATQLRIEKHRDPSFTISVVPLMDQVVGNVRGSLFVLFGAVGFVLLIACTNVANLLLSRASSRKKEIAVRSALGAGRRRVVRQLLTESLMLSFLGGAAGVAIAQVCLEAIRLMHPGNIPRLDELGMDYRVLAFAFAISFLTGVAFGLLPALRVANVDLNTTLKAGSRGARSGGLSVGRDRLRGVLVIGELAISIPLLIGAGLLVRSFLRILEIPPGFNPDHVASLQISAEGIRYQDRAQRVQFYNTLEQRVRNLPGVTAEGLVSALPLTPAVGWGGVNVEGYTPPPNQPEIQVDKRASSVDYFHAMQIPVVQGRTFAPDDMEKPASVIIDEKMAHFFWPHGDAIGKHVRGNDKQPWSTVIGVVGVVKEYGLDEDTRMVMYMPYVSTTNYLVARTTSDPGEMGQTIVAQIHAIDPEIPVYNVATMNHRLSDSLARQRFSMTMLASFAVFAMVLAAVGLYGVMAYLVEQGTGEIAIRMALGAPRSGVLALILRQGMLLACVGIFLGLSGAILLTRLMASLLFHVSAYDGVTFCGVASLLLCVALAACVFPARKAMRVEPMQALRVD